MLLLSQCNQVLPKHFNFITLGSSNNCVFTVFTLASTHSPLAALTAMSIFGMDSIRRDFANTVVTPHQFHLCLSIRMDHC